MNTQPKASQYRKATLLFCLVLLAGIALGASGMVLYLKHFRHRPPPGPMRAEHIGKDIQRRLGQTLSLTEAERTAIAALIDARMQDVDALRRKSFDDMAEVFDSMNDELDAMLGPERSEQWERHKQQHYGKRYRAKDKRHHGLSHHSGN